MMAIRIITMVKTVIESVKIAGKEPIIRLAVRP